MSNNEKSKERTTPSKQSSTTTTTTTTQPRSERRLRTSTFRRVVKAPDGDGPRPGAYTVPGRAYGEVPTWIQNARRQQRPRNDPSDRTHLVSDAEVVTEEVLPEDFFPEVVPIEYQVMAAAVVIERRCAFQRLREFTNPNNVRARLRRTNNRGQQPPVAEEDTNLIPSERIIATAAAAAPAPTTESEFRSADPKIGIDVQGLQRSTGSLLEDNDELYYVQDKPEPNNNIDIMNDDVQTTTGVQRSTGSLLEDDDEIHAQDRFLQGLQSARIPEDDEMTETHPHVLSVVEVFPEVNRKHIMQLLRQESLATTFLILAEESSAYPSDDVIFPTELKHATTYAQASVDDRLVIMSYLMDMFPDIPSNQIENVLMLHSTHHGVSILSEEGGVTTASPTRSAPAVAAANQRRLSLIDSDDDDDDDDKDDWQPNAATQKRRSLIDDDDDKDNWQPSNHRISQIRRSPIDDDEDNWQPTTNNVPNHRIPQQQKQAVEFQPAAAGIVRQRSASYDNVLEMVLQESRVQALLEQNCSFAIRNPVPSRPRQPSSEMEDIYSLDRKQQPRGSASSVEFDILKPVKKEPSGNFYDLNGL